MKTTKKDFTLNEQDSLQDMLDVEKQLLTFYTTAIAEGSCKNLRKKLMENFALAQDDQFKIFEQMETNGYYTVQPVDKTMLDQKLDTFSKVGKQLCSTVSEG